MGGARPFLFGALVGGAIGGGAAYALLLRGGGGSVEGADGERDGERKGVTDVRRATGNGDDDAAMMHPAMRMGWPVGTESLLRMHSGFVASFDARTRNPRWVLEVLNKSTMSGPGNRKRSQFVEDETFGERFRNKLSDFRGSGYDRGHLAAAAGHKDSQLAMDETFRLCNISPQVGEGFNRDYWARLERFTRDVAHTTGGDVLVATGPLFLPTRTKSSASRDGGAGEGKSGGRDSAAHFEETVGGSNVSGALAMITPVAAAEVRPATEYEMRYPLLGSAPELTAVPTHFFKVILVAQPSSSKFSSAPVAAAAFVLPNAPIPADTPMENFVVPLTQLEAAAGLSFFRQGALGGAARDAYEVAEGKFIELRDERVMQRRLAGAAEGEDSRALAALSGKETSRRLGKTLHVCQLTACELPVDQYAKGGVKYKGKESSTSRGMRS